jgi:hypothetical protein
VDWLIMHPIGARMQDANWNALVERMIEESGGTVPEGVQHEQHTLDDEQTAEIERWLADLVRARKRRERMETRSPEHSQHESRPRPTVTAEDARDA